MAAVDSQTYPVLLPGQPDHASLPTVGPKGTLDSHVAIQAFSTIVPSAPAGQTVAAHRMLNDGSNPEGVDPNPPLNWSTRADLEGLVVYGQLTSPPFMKLLSFLIYHKVVFKWVNKPGKPNSHYKKQPVIVVGGRQVNDTMIIVKYLLPVLGMRLNTEWDTRMDTEFRTTMMMLMSSEDAGKLAGNLILPCACMGRCIGGMVAHEIHKQGKRNMEKNPACKVGDMTEIAKEFKKEFKGKFHGGRNPDSVDITFYGYLSPGLLAGTSFAQNCVFNAGLHEWLAAMRQFIPSELLFKPGDALHAFSMLRVLDEILRVY